MTLFVALIIFSNSFDLETKFGFKRYITIISLSALASTSLAILIGAFFGLIPGINTVPYFRGFWMDPAAVGPTQICILLAIFEWRINGQTETLCCCCFKIKIWVVCLINIFMCQIIMNRPWNGLWYNVAAVIIGWSVPKSFLVVREMESVGFVDVEAA